MNKYLKRDLKEVALAFIAVLVMITGYTLVRS